MSKIILPASPEGFVWTSFRADDDDRIVVKDSKTGKDVILNHPRLAVPVTEEAAIGACKDYSRTVTDVDGEEHPTSGIVAAVGKSYWHAAEAIIGQARATKGKNGLRAGLPADKVLANLMAMRAFGGRENAGRSAAPSAEQEKEAAKAEGIVVPPEVEAFLRKRGAWV